MIPYDEIDEKMREPIRVMNDLPGVVTHYCCEGHEPSHRTGTGGHLCMCMSNNHINRAYILFTCSDEQSLIRLIKVTEPFGRYMQIELNQYKDVLRYSLEFVQPILENVHWLIQQFTKGVLDNGTVTVNLMDIAPANPSGTPPSQRDDADAALPLV